MKEYWMGNWGSGPTWPKPSRWPTGEYYPNDGYDEAG